MKKPLIAPRTPSRMAPAGAPIIAVTAIVEASDEWPDGSMRLDGSAFAYRYLCSDAGSCGSPSKASAEVGVLKRQGPCFGIQKLLERLTTALMPGASVPEPIGR